MKKKNPIVINLISLIITAVLGFIYFYVSLPALNIHDKQFYSFIIGLVIVYLISMLLLTGVRTGDAKLVVSELWRVAKIGVFVFAAVIIITVIGALTGVKLFRAASYSNLMTIEQGDFTQDVSEISMNQIPLLDKDSANTLANRKLGELSDLVSQFNVSDDSSQLNYHNKPVRVNYLNYDSFFKWFKNRKAGLPAYMITDMVTQEVSVVRLDDGVKYSPSEYFNNDLMRKLRFIHPGFIYDEVNFEIDEDGMPYWIASVVTKRIGLFDGDDIAGAVILNAVTGESAYYPMSEIPTWVDKAVSADMVMTQYDYYGSYHNGFFNRLFTQTDCTETTDGYNYLALNDDVYFYSGITSISGDRGNIGFILVNQRTKEAKYYVCAGAEEYSAMSSAEGAVQQYSYKSTFPLLLNIADEPTYFMALKDYSGLVKMYAYVNVQQYQLVGTGTSVASAQKAYTDLLTENRIIEPVPEEVYEDALGEEAPAETPQAPVIPTPAPEPEEVLNYNVPVIGTITEIRRAEVSGNTMLYLYITSEDGSSTICRLSVADDESVILLNEGEEISLLAAAEDAGKEILRAVKK